MSRAASSSERRPSQTNPGADRHHAKSGSFEHSSSCHAPTSSRTSSGIRSATPRSSDQSVRQPRCPSDTATTAPPGSGAGNESAASPTSVGSGRPASRSSSASLPETTNVSADREAAASCSSASRAAHLRRRVVGDLVAIPAPVPQLRARHREQQRARQRPLHRMEDDDGPQVAGDRAQQPPRRATREHVANERRQPRDGAVAHARRVGGDDPRRAHEVARLVLEDEALQRPGQQQHDSRLGLRHARTVAWRRCAASSPAC